MLEKIYIENFLSLVNEQELKISNRITTLIGGNAAGKTSILKAISKLNGESIDTKEKNINHKNDETKIFAKFRMSVSEQKEINSIYHDEDDNRFILYPASEDIFYNLYLKENGELEYSLCNQNEEEINLIELSIPTIINYFDDLLKEIENDEVKIKIIDKISNKNTISKVLDELTEEEKNMITDNIKNMLSKLSKEITDLSNTLIPNYKFIYMNSFKDVLVDKILIDDIDKNKTVLNFLDIAGIKKEEIINAVNSDDRQQIRTIENKTVSVVTQHFKKIFSQVKDDEYFKISMTIDNKNRSLDFWIQNKITGEAVLPFSAESEGMQWYLSMYLRLYEYFNNIEENTKYILLLDEPNIYLHAEAQYDLLNNVFKQKLRDVQIIYSTHSPYMIDAEDLYSLRIVDKDDETKIFNMTIDYLKFKRKNEKIGDVDVLSPALIATGINISNQLTISPSDKIIVVEGPHDYYMLSAMKEILKIDDNDIKIIPCHGATKVPFMCSYLYGLGYNIVALLDNDTDGRKAMKELSFENEDLDFIKVLLYSKKDNDSNNCILEDLFSEGDRIKYMPQKSTVNYRTIYDSRSNIKFDSETKSNFKNIFKFINNSFK